MTTCASADRAAARGDKDGLPQVRDELAEVAKRRPEWSRVPLCLGQIEELEGRENRALENYMRAVDLGERQFELLRRTVQLLYKHKRYTDAELVIQRLTEQTPALGDLQRVAAEISLQTGDYNRALELADKAVAENSTDYRDYVWLGQVLWAASQRAEDSRRSNGGWSRCGRKRPCGRAPGWAGKRRTAGSPWCSTWARSARPTGRTTPLRRPADSFPPRTPRWPWPSAMRR